MSWKKIKPIIFIFVLFFFFGFSQAIFADSSQLAQAQDEQMKLQAQLLDIENQISQIQQQLNSIKGQKNTLQNKIKQLQKQQAALNLQIRATNLRIAELGGQITATQTAINQNILKSQELQKQLAGLIREIYQQDDYPFLYTVLSQSKLSDTVAEIASYSSVTESLRGVLEQTKQVKQQLDQEQQNLVQQQDDAKNFLSIKTLQQQQLAGSVDEQNFLLSETKGREADYQITLNDTQKRANEIRGRLYQLLGVSSQITFGEAVTIAQWSSQQTGVRAAFLLAILTQESNLGKNVGTCNRPGDGPEKSWKVVMKPDRDQQPFLQITQELGMDPDITPVSCPMRDSKGRQVGWGGAMGPAQFIPSTWMGYKDQVTAVTGKPANPWDIRDAFMAAAIKLKAGGAGTVDGEWAAAMRYFSGSTNTKYRFYGDNVVSIANQYQSDIEALNK